MSKINCYFVNQINDEIKVLFEILDKTDNNLSSFYYELLLKENDKNSDNKNYEIKSVKEIYNIFEYLYNNFNGNIKKSMLNISSTEYIIKLLNMHIYKKQIDDRLKSRLLKYNFDSSENNDKQIK